MLLSKGVVCDSKKNRFSKEKDAERLLIMIGKIPILATLLI